MTRAEADAMVATVRAVMPLKGPFRIQRVETQEPLPGDFVTVVWFDDNPNPCVIGGEAGTDAWADAHGKAVERGQQEVPAWDCLVRRLIGGEG